MPDDLKSPPNSRGQLLTELSDRHVIPVVDIDRPDLKNKQFISPAYFNTSRASGEINPTYPSGAPQILSGMDVMANINMISALTKINTTGAGTSIWPNGTKRGLVKTVRMFGHVGDCVVTVTTAEMQTITFSAVDQFIQMMWDGTEWFILDLHGVVTAN